jgi:GT2 family glycosyltransferase
MKLIVGFLTYNELSSKYLKEFLGSLEKALGFLNRSDFKVFAFDNSPLDNSENKLFINEFNVSHNNLIEYFTENKNLGFGKAFNILINKAKFLEAEYFLVLNPDMILDPEAVKRLLEVMERDSELSAVAPKIYYWDFLKLQKTNKIDSLGIIVKPGLRFYDLGQGAEDIGQFDNQQIIGPSGAAGLFRLKDLDNISLINDNRKQYFDERFFMYKEDCDLAYRLYLAHLKTAIVPGALVYHDRSSGADRQTIFKKITNRFRKSRQIRAWSLQNQNILYSKYWKNQNFVNKILVIFWFLVSLFFSLILEQFNLKTYFKRL